MRNYLAAIAFAAAATFTPAAMATVPPIGGLAPDLDYFPRQRRGKGQSNRRGKGKRNPPKQHSNRLTISKRVRRKHRRRA